MRRPVLLSGIILFAAFLSPTASSAQNITARNSDHNRAAMLQAIDQELKLAPEQKAGMDKLRTEFESRQKSLREELKAKREALRVILDGNSPGRAAADALGVEINTLQGAMMQNHIDHIFKIRALLTPEQYTRLEEFRKKHREERKGEKKKHRAEEIN